MEIQKSTEVSKEKSVHGNKWNKIHGGYFSSRKNADVLLKMLKIATEQFQPDVIVDLGAGTGTILHWLSEILDSTHPKLVAMDISDNQLAVIKEKYCGKIIPVNDSFTNFKRDGIPQLSESTGIFISRSTFHYVGENFFSRLIQHIRSQMKTGEHFIHQTASFSDKHNASLLNHLYKMMHSAKWYPSVKLMKQVFENNNFKVYNILPCTPLPLESSDLQIRYALNDNDIEQIKNTIENKYPDADSNVFISSSNSFTAYLHYFCMHCVAI